MNTSNSSKKNLTWSDDIDDFLIDSLSDQMHKGQKIGRCFTKTAFATVAHLIRKKFRLVCHSDHIKNRMKTLKKNFGATKEILNTSGFGFNYSTQRIEGAVGVWELYIKVRLLFHCFFLSFDLNDQNCPHICVGIDIGTSKIFSISIQVY